MSDVDPNFTREKTAFEHNAAQMRALNDQMGKIPAASVTLTGGLWFAAAQTPVPEVSIKFWILLFACVANVCLILAAIRVRDVLQSYIEAIEKFAPNDFARGKPKNPILGKLGSYSMIFIYCFLMGMAALMSFVGAITFYWPWAQNPHVAVVGILLIVAFLLIIAVKGGIGTDVSPPPA